MTAKHLDRFAERHGAPTNMTPASQEVIDRFAPIAPRGLRDYWERFGFSVFLDGWFQIVNPSLYAPVIDAWIKGTDLEGRDEYIAVTRSAFGEVRVWGKKTGYDFNISPTSGTMDLCQRNNQIDLENGEADKWGESIMWKGTRWPQKPEDQQKDFFVRLFLQARERHGPLGDEQMYGFVPATHLGGEMVVAHTQIVSAPEHLIMLAGLSEKSVLTFDDLVKRAYGEKAVENVTKMMKGGL